MRFTHVTLLLVLLSRLAVAADRAPAPQIGFEVKTGEVVITADQRPIASYVYLDPAGNTPRPFFAHVTAPNGLQVTRNHPPIPEKDRTDHETMHPGIWLAFGDLDGSDFWRNKAKVAHVRFVKSPLGRRGSGSFIEEKQYLRADNSVICNERFHCQVHVRQDSYLLVWDSTFSSKNAFYFGDQEEMGLGMRVATPLSEMNGGQLRDSEGRQGAKAIWSQSAKWCDYRGEIEGQRVGMTLLCHPANFRPAWMHARDYGFVAANPFGRKAMNKGATSKVVVKPGDTLRLRYGILIHSGNASRKSRLEAAYADYVELTKGIEP